MTNLNCLLLYVREDGIFARVFRGSEVRDGALRETVTEETLRQLLRTLLIRLLKSNDPISRYSFTVTYVLSRKVSVLGHAIATFLSGLSFVDSVCELRRDEVFFRAAEQLSRKNSNAPQQILFCGSRETRLFTESGEYPLANGLTGGNGFYDFLLRFVSGEGDSFAYHLQQKERLEQLFSAYRVYPYPEEDTELLETRIYPNSAEYPSLTERPSHRHNLLFSFVRHPIPRKKATDVTESEPIRYFALSHADREKVDRRYPALYRAVRDNRDHRGKVTMGEAAEVFRRLLDPMETLPLTDLTVVGSYSRFSLLQGFLSTLPQKPKISYASESLLVLDGLSAAVKERLASSRISFRDIDGDEIVLWESGAPLSDKRVSFAATLKASVSKEEWGRRVPLLPYKLSLTELQRTEENAFVRRTRETAGDLKEFCYKRQKDGSYLLSLPASKESEGSLRTVLLGISATASGVCCHLLEPGGEA